MPKQKAKKAKREQEEEEEEDDDSAISTADRNSTRKEEEVNDDNPPSLSKSKKVKKKNKKNKNSINSVENQESPVEKSKSKPPEVTKEEEKEEEKDKKKKMMKKERVQNDEKKVDRKNMQEKKVHDLPGQKHERPNERDPLRIFYETLFRQFPDSELASTWMMEWGLLPPDKAQRLHEEKLNKNLRQKSLSLTKVVSPKKRSKDFKDNPLEHLVEAKKRRASENREDLISPKAKTKKQKVSSG